MAYEYLDHTADIGVRGRGAGPENAVEAVLQGLLDLVFDEVEVVPRQVREVRASAGADDERIVGFLNEVLFMMDGERWLPARVVAVWREGDALVGRFAGEPFDRGRHAHLSEVKAATFHGFRMERCGDDWELEVIFDV